MTTDSIVTKTDLRGVQLLKVDLEKALHRQTWTLGIMFAQGAFIVAVLQLLN